EVDDPPVVHVAAAETAIVQVGPTVAPLARRHVRAVDVKGSRRSGGQAFDSDAEGVVVALVPRVDPDVPAVVTGDFELESRGPDGTGGVDLRALVDDRGFDGLALEHRLGGVHLEGLCTAAARVSGGVAGAVGGPGRTGVGRTGVRRTRVRRARVRRAGVRRARVRRVGVGRARIRRAGVRGPRARRAGARARAFATRFGAIRGRIIGAGLGVSRARVRGITLAWIEAVVQ